MAQPSLRFSLSLFFPPSLPFDVSLQSTAASQASPPRLILSAQAAHSCGFHPRHDSRRRFTQPCRPLPVQGSRVRREQQRGLGCRRGARGKNCGGLIKGASLCKKKKKVSSLESEELNLEKSDLRSSLAARNELESYTKHCFQL